MKRALFNPGLLHEAVVSRERYKLLKSWKPLKMSLGSSCFFTGEFLIGSPWTMKKKLIRFAGS